MYDESSPFKQFFTFDPLNLPSSRRLMQREEQEQESARNTKRRRSTSSVPGLDATHHSTFSQKEQVETEHDLQKELQRPKYEMRSKFGQTVFWSNDFHYTSDELEPYRKVGDREMDVLLDLCAAEGIEGAGRFDDIVSISAEAVQHVQQQQQMGEPASSARQALASFHAKYSTPPDFVDWDQLQRGIDVFVTYAPAAGSSLYYRSLIGGFSIPKITQVLFATRYLAPPCPPEKVRERLLDTGGFIASCMMQSIENGNGGEQSSTPVPASSIRPGQPGWQMALRVRHLHARVRRSILHSKKLHWDIEEFGIPINQEDMSATLLAFSVNVLVGVEFVAGKALVEQEQRDYLALWRYLGWLLGVETRTSEQLADANSDRLPPFDPCSGIKANCTVSQHSDPIGHSYSALESIIFHLLNPNDVSQKVAQHLLNIGRAKKPSNASETTKQRQQHQDHLGFGYKYRSFMCRRYLGHNLSNALDLSCPPKYSLSYGLLFCLTTIHLTMMRMYTLATMHIPFFRRSIQRWHSNGMGKFYGIWSVEHGKRVRRAYRNNNGNAESFNISNKNGKTLNMDFDGGEEAKASSSCPFAMIMQPQ